MKESGVRYRVCPRCFRAVPAASGEGYCANDGQRLLTAFPRCGAAITSPYARHCVRCGQGYAATVPAGSPSQEDG